MAIDVGETSHDSIDFPLPWLYPTGIASLETDE
jgi:hypothetical protein